VDRGASRLAVVVPLTGTDWINRLHIRIEPPEGGLGKNSFARCDQVRTVGTMRFGGFLGTVSSKTMSDIADRLAILLDIPAGL
jgi:mRNA-degrading endonuclease toxin of MazEF toxin-antitoxin module